MQTKKITASVLAVMMTAAALAGCGCSKGGSEESENNNSVYIAKVDGKSLISEASAEDSRAEMGDVEVTIGDAKLIEQNGDDVAVVEFTFKNNGDEETSFTGSLRADGFQDEAQLVPTVISGVDGIDMLSLSQNIGKGHQISVNKAYRLRNRDDIFELQVTQITGGTEEPQALTKYYSIPG